MDCRKCGAKHITRRRAGVFSCKHCGVQPGPMGLDRGGSILADVLAGPDNPEEVQDRNSHPAIFDAKGNPQTCPVAQPGEF